MEHSIASQGIRTQNMFEKHCRCWHYDSKAQLPINATIQRVSFAQSILISNMLLHQLRVFTVRSFQLLGIFHFIINPFSLFEMAKARDYASTSSSFQTSVNAIRHGRATRSRPHFAFKSSQHERQGRLLNPSFSLYTTLLLLDVYPLTFISSATQRGDLLKFACFVHRCFPEEPQLWLRSRLM